MNESIACTRAMLYLAWRKGVRRARETRIRPWTVIGPLAGIGMVALLQITVLARLSPGTGDSEGALLRAAELLALVPALSLMTATRRSPLRLSEAEASWLLTAPGGGRVVFARYLITGPVRLTFIVFAGMALSGLWSGLSIWSASKVAAAGGVVMLVFTMLSAGRHLVAVRTARALTVTRAAGMFWALAIGISLITDFPSAEWVRLQPIAELLVTMAFRPETVSAGSVVIILGLLAGTAVMLITTAKGFHEEADRAARQAAQVRETLQRSRSNQELGAAHYRSGIRSIGPRPTLRGERALLFRAIAQERRTILDNLTLPLMVLVLVVILGILTPRYSWLPLLPMATNLIITNTIEGVAVEQDHQFLRLTGMRPLHALVWVNAVAFVRTTTILEVLWLGLLPLSPLGSATWAAGAVISP